MCTLTGFLFVCLINKKLSIIRLVVSRMQENIENPVLLTNQWDNETVPCMFLKDEPKYYF
ncbi:Hypothetical protein LUCI_3661 [Lucifera butyrica]|uniref:Uncharacterized protein n=1 Tax=Lucifera butyrica TaxID=1351585 RepID=A0A498RBN4_9FIRM|nr:Hypothetical protein LUCI_3588 [Lucifera butyrica]VBB08389.1 Hypothetical protein LUCI_3661 [Lucifera butyrica]